MSLMDFIMTNVRTAHSISREDLFIMATDNKMYNDRGNDSSGTSSAQSPLSQDGGSSMPQALGDVKTDFDPMSISGEARSDD